MTVESSMKRWLIFSRRFLSAMMWSCEYGADEDDAEILAEALLAGGDTCCVIFGTATPLPPPPPLSACSAAAAEYGWGASFISCADAEWKSQLTGWLVPLLQLPGAVAAHMAECCGGDQAVADAAPTSSP